MESKAKMAQKLYMVHTYIYTLTTRIPINKETLTFAKKHMQAAKM